ncbi:MAG TPA: penicillin-binding protein 2 [Thermoleophilaceae bacterium]
MYLDNENRPAITPQLALRVAILGGIALVMFAIIFFRLWYLQVLSGDKYLAQAKDNQIRNVLIHAPRGKIVDRNGNVLVDNRIGYAVTISPDKLPKTQAVKTELYTRLARVLHMSRREIRTTVRTQLRAQPFAKATVKTDVRRDVFAYILEHQTSFPGISVDQVYLRSYPQHTLAAQIMGTVGRVTAEELKLPDFKGVDQNDTVGQTGIESSYDRYLRGVDGAARVQVDASGNLRNELAKKEPVPGHQLRLSLNMEAQKIGQATLQGRKGAFVAMDVHNGSIYALGSSPTFDPNVFSNGVKESTYKRLNDPNNGAPLANRAIQGLYPTGSTFKPITAVAALSCGVITPTSILYDGGTFKQQGTVVRHNAGNAIYGPLNVTKALQVSSDVFFFNMGADLANSCGGLQLQKWARKLGIGRKTGIDLPGENPGFLPTPQAVDKLHKENPKIFDRGWYPGDNVNLAVGQGFLEADPLQMAVAYGAIATGYKVRPHLAMRVEDSEGRALQEFSTPARQKVDINPLYRQAIMNGIYAAANDQGGTSVDVFKGFPIKVCGKTGTAEKGLGRQDQSWYVVLAPCPNPQYVVAVTDEQGGFGAQTAAPDARRILAALFGIKNQENKVVRGSSKTL